MAAKKRAYLSSNPERDLNKFYTEDAYKSHHYKKRFLLGYMQYDLNAPARDTTEDEALAYHKANCKLYDLSSYKSDSDSEFIKTSNNLFTRKNEKRKVTNSDLNSTGTLNERQKRIDKSDKEPHNDLEKSTDKISSRQKSACHSPTVTYNQEDVCDITEMPLNLIINETLPISNDINRQCLSNDEASSENIVGETKPVDEKATVLEPKV